MFVHRNHFQSLHPTTYSQNIKYETGNLELKVEDFYWEANNYSTINFLVRYYDSTTKIEGIFGKGWISNFEVTIKENKDTIGNAGHNIPPSPEKIEHPQNHHKNLIFNSLKPNIGWLTFSDFGGLNHPAQPIGN
ncbi:DUF6531 domain-containing protein [Flagellimonas oceanensis]|uniref:DUF6531 domain-containing protein n=1 Tax=Flagellimonas oceanensis TaxID=2499163 RepID=UPI003BAC3F1B